MEEKITIEELDKLYPARLRKRLMIANWKLIVITILWITVAIYSLVATFYGYKVLNLGNISFILAFASQLFTVIYAVPYMNDINTKIFKKFAIPIWIIIAAAAHIISFGGSAFYHLYETPYRKKATVFRLFYGINPKTL